MDSLEYLDLSWPAPEENLACDEALLEAGEEGRGRGVLRFWKPSQSFVVLGYGNRANDEVNPKACRLLGIPVLRRCTGGGAVLQGPGCLNYSLVLAIDAIPELHSVTATNRLVMETNRRALAPLVDHAVQVQGVTDLALGDLKCSGNAQRRRRRCLLFHGSFLLDLEVELMETVLKRPSQQPAYRRNRSHREFLTRLNVAAEDIKAALRQAWNAPEALRHIPSAATQRLVREKYSREEWNLSR